jgi:hypothetical protein
MEMEINPQNFRANLHDRDRVASYFYRVVQDVVAFKNNEVVNSYHHTEDFDNPEIKKARQDAIQYLTERYRTLPEGFIFPYLTPEEHAADPGKEFSAYSHSILFVEFYSDEIFEEWPIAGEHEEDVREGLEHETEIWMKNGLGAPPFFVPVK